MNSFRSRAVLFAAIVLTAPLVTRAQQNRPPAKTAATASVKPKIRTITAFINLDPVQYQQQVAETIVIHQGVHEKAARVRVLDLLD